MRVSYKDAVDALAKSGMAPDDLLKAIDAREIDVRCEGMTEFTFVIREFKFKNHKVDAVIYIDPFLLDHDSGVVRIDEIRAWPSGLHRSRRPPYWHVFNHGDGFTLYVPSHEGLPSNEPRVLSSEFLRYAELLPDASAFVDNLDTLQRQHARDVTLDFRAFEQRFLTTANDENKSTKPTGKPPNYRDTKCDEAFQKWLRTNPLVDVDQRVSKLREIYTAARHKVGQDEKARAEKRKIKELLARLNRANTC